MKQQKPLTRETEVTPAFTVCPFWYYLPNHTFTEIGVESKPHKPAATNVCPQSFINLSWLKSPHRFIAKATEDPKVITASNSQPLCKISKVITFQFYKISEHNSSQETLHLYSCNTASKVFTELVCGIATVGYIHSSYYGVLSLSLFECFLAQVHLGVDHCFQGWFHLYP